MHRLFAELIGNPYAREPYAEDPRAEDLARRRRRLRRRQGTNRRRHPVTGERPTRRAA
jgi:hypothetical protein